MQADKDTKGRPQEVPEKKGPENLHKQSDSGGFRRPKKDATKADMDPPEEGEHHSKVHATGVPSCIYTSLLSLAPPHRAPQHG